MGLEIDKHLSIRIHFCRLVSFLGSSIICNRHHMELWSTLQEAAQARKELLGFALFWSVVERRKLTRQAVAA